MLNDRNDLEIGGLGDWLPDWSNDSTLKRLSKGVVSLAGGEFFTPMDRMERMGHWHGWRGWTAILDSGLRRNDGLGGGMTVLGFGMTVLGPE